MDNRNGNENSSLYISFSAQAITSFLLPDPVALLFSLTYIRPFNFNYYTLYIRRAPSGAPEAKTARGRHASAQQPGVASLRLGTPQVASPDPRIYVSRMLFLLERTLLLSATPSIILGLSTDDNF